MTVADIMTKEVFTCRTGDSLDTPAQLMWEHDCGCVPVVDDEGDAVGLVTDRDICMAGYTSNKPLSALRVGDGMSKVLYGCMQSDSVADAEELMRSKQIRRVPVIDGGKVVGILSLNDVAVACAEESKRGKNTEVTSSEVGETLAAICAHRPSKAAEVVSAP